MRNHPALERTTGIGRRRFVDRAFAIGCSSLAAIARTLGSTSTSRFAVKRENP